MPTNTPDFSFERQYNGPVCGVDEAGRGPLAGPVVAAAVILNPKTIPDGLNDSKALSEIRRELLLNNLIKDKTIFIGIGVAEPEEIDRLNILHASMIAMRRAVLNLPVAPHMALIDGNRLPPDMPCDAEAIIKGDARSLSIAAASIVAKVTRDKIMKEADIRFPGYGLAGHKGYPTKAHKAALLQIGASPIHRRSFRPVAEVMGLKL
ncbi:RNase HII [Litorimonas taeanensis]|uniref:Ribonuclease HII n=1 Tax=Litorimonas taeanensis TaxID=568099 RepID=A0A420WIY7_9PROT|nr:ribonuclease HII [Litorimonas taeanensis]RKQ70980.1 RNase HII [Litorimonas taeanensis]